jgi:hypothetical protein
MVEWAEQQGFGSASAIVASRENQTTRHPLAASKSASVDFITAAEIFEDPDLLVVIDPRV